MTLVNNLRKLVQWTTSDLMWTEKGVLRTPNEQVPLLGPTAQLYAHGFFYYPYGVTDTKIIYTLSYCGNFSEVCLKLCVG